MTSLMVFSTMLAFILGLVLGSYLGVVYGAPAWLNWAHEERQKQRRAEWDVKNTDSDDEELR